VQLAVWIAYPQVIPFKITAIYLPILLVLSFCLATGIGLMASALNTFYEDVKYLLSVFLYLLFYLCPIIYFSENVYAAKQLHFPGNSLYTLYHLNPFAMLSTAYRKILVAPQDVKIPQGSQVETIPWLPLDWPFLGLTAVTCFAILIAGYALFNRLKWRFVERP
jgi:ABC-type polysaccharide/polyol phosphate export permease